MKLLSIAIVSTFLTSSVLADGLSFEKAWVRAVPEVSKVSAGFGTIVNSTNRDRKLIAVESDISKVTEIHSHKHRNGVMRMRRVDFIKIKKNSSKKLKPMSYHIMFIGLLKPLKNKQKVAITLIFDNGYKLQKNLEVTKN